MFCACIFHGNSMNDLLSYYGLVDAKIRVSDKDLPVRSQGNYVVQVPVAQVLFVALLVF